MLSSRPASWSPEAPGALKPTGWTLSGSFASWPQSLPAIPVLAGPWSCRPWKRKTRKRPHREREFLVQERVRSENRIAASLATQGVRERPSLRSWDADMRALGTGDGRPLPTHLVAELNRLRRRLSLTIPIHNSPPRDPLRDHRRARSILS